MSFVCLSQLLHVRVQQFIKISKFSGNVYVVQDVEIFCSEGRYIRFFCNLFVIYNLIGHSVEKFPGDSLIPFAYLIAFAKIAMYFNVRTIQCIYNDKNNAFSCTCYAYFKNMCIAISSIKIIQLKKKKTKKL